VNPLLGGQGDTVPVRLSDQYREARLPVGKLTGVFEMIEGHLSILADLDEVAVGITHVAPPAVIVEWLGKKERSFVAPLLVAGPNVGDTQVKKATHSVAIRRCFKEDLWLVGRRATAGIENDPGMSQLDVAGIVRLDHFPAKNSDIEVLRFFLVSHGEEVSGKEAFVCNRRVG
jgi:hypothetical protein